MTPIPLSIDTTAVRIHPPRSDVLHFNYNPTRNHHGIGYPTIPPEIGSSGTIVAKPTIGKTKTEAIDITINLMDIQNRFVLRNPDQINKYLQSNSDVAHALLRIWDLLDHDFAFTQNPPKLEWDGDVSSPGQLYVILPILTNVKETMQRIKRFEHEWQFSQPLRIIQNITLTI